MKLLKKLYDKSELWFAISWIIAYCVLMSVADTLSAFVGVDKSVTLVIGLLLSALILYFIHKNDLSDVYGLCRPKVKPGAMLYYIPLLVMLTANFWYGVKLNYGIISTLLYILSMLCVGFLEELIFRGLLFNAMRKDNFRTAVIVSSVTFGIGHIINLINGSGAELLPNLLQVVYATAAGFMFVMIYYKSGSLLACIAAHGVFNALSAFADEANASGELRILSAVLLTVIAGAYAVYLAWTVKGRKND